MKLNINCGDAILLKDSKGFLEGFSELILNCGNLVISEEMQASLSQKGGMTNAGNTQVIPTPKNPVLTSGRLDLTKDVQYKDAFLLCNGDCVISTEGMASVEEMEGLLVTGSCYYPVSMDALSLGRIQCTSKIAYPDGWQVHSGDMTLDAETVRGLGREANIFVTGRLFAMSEQGIAMAVEQGCRFQSKGLYISEDFAAKGEAVIGQQERVLVPSGHALVLEEDSLRSLFYSHGDKIYCLCGLVIQPRDKEDLARFSSIIVRQTVRMSDVCAEAARGIVKADKFKVFSGELVRANGERKFSHATLDAARKKGVRYALEINGSLTFEQDVTVEDMEAIAALDYNGVVVASGEVQMALNSVLGSGNGTMTDKFEEGNSNPFEIFGADVHLINAGDYILI